MKKIFELTHPKIKVARMVESVKHDVKKYVKRERNKKLADGVDFWDFACKFGHTQADAKVVHLSELNNHIDAAERQQVTSFYIEIIAKEGFRTKKDILEEL